MRVTILGNSGPFQAAGGACSGYLVETAQTKILLDCGNGVLSNLQEYCTFADLDMILLSHLHSDHMSDMMVLKYAVSIKNKRGTMNKVIPVYAPANPIDEYDRLDVKDAFNLNPMNEELTLDYKDIKITFKQMNHPVQSFAIAVEENGKKLVYSGDTAWNEELIDFAQGAEMLLVDAGLQQTEKTSDNVPHLTCVEVGIIGKRANVKRLMLTHFWPEHDKTISLREAQENYLGAEISEVLSTYEI